MNDTLPQKMSAFLAYKQAAAGCARLATVGTRRGRIAGGQSGSDAFGHVPYETQ